jgi:tryptophan synthase alpha chain
MNRIAQRFQELREKKQAAFIPFITGGDPTLAMSEDIAVALGKTARMLLNTARPSPTPWATAR